jgi:ABC-type multidrug transport system fused ATPase/permease subunit
MSERNATMPPEEITAAARLHARAGDVHGLPSWATFTASLVPALLVMQIVGHLVNDMIGLYVGVTVALVFFLALNHYLDHRRLRRARADWFAKLTWVNELEGEDAVRSALIWSETTPDNRGIPRLNQVLADGQHVATYLDAAHTGQLIAAITDRDNWHVLLRIADLARNDLSKVGAPAGWDAYTALAFPEIVDAILASDFDPRIVNGFQSPTKPSALGHLKGTLRRPVQI